MVFPLISASFRPVFDAGGWPTEPGAAPKWRQRSHERARRGQKGEARQQRGAWLASKPSLALDVVMHKGQRRIKALSTKEYLCMSYIYALAYMYAIIIYNIL